MGRFCFCARASFCLVRKDLWLWGLGDGLAILSMKREWREGGGGEGRYRHCDGSVVVEVVGRDCGR